MPRKTSPASHLDPMVERSASVHAGWKVPDHPTGCDRKLLPSNRKSLIGLVDAESVQTCVWSMHKGVEDFACSRGTHATPHHHDIAILVIIHGWCPGEVHVSVQKIKVALLTMAH